MRAINVVLSLLVAGSSLARSRDVRASGTMIGSPEEPRLITSEGRQLLPACTVVATRHSVNRWPISGEQIRLYEFAQGRNVALANGQWYAITAVDTSWARTDKILHEGRYSSINDIDALLVGSQWRSEPLQSRKFFFELNDYANSKCHPSIEH